MSIQMKITLAIALALLAGSCASRPLLGDSGERAISMQPLYGSSLSGVVASESPSAFSLSLSSVPSNGQFIRLSLPQGVNVSAQSWSNDSNVLRLLVPTPSGADLGVVPTAGYAGETVSLSVTLGTGSRTVSKPPIGSINVITDLAVTSAGAGLVNLHWTQLNAGDYDFNGEVNIADITPLALHLGDVIDRAAAGADQNPDYWLDGDKNGEVNMADLTPIGLYFTCFVNGYNIKQNGTTIPGAGGSPPTVSRDQRTPHVGLPPTYDIQIAGLVTDSWVVASVDQAGVEGADSGGGIGPADLVANLSITGQDLFNLVGSGTGPFGPGKFSSRVIDPIDVVTSAPLGQTSVSGVQTRVTGLPKSKTLLARFYYAPTVNLATGAPKGGASVRGGAGLRNVSDVPESEQEVASVPFDMPATGSVGVDTGINLLVNPAGGYFVDLTATITYPGDNPSTVTVENGYQIIYKKRLSYAANLVAQDNNDDGDYDDDAAYQDSDNDCISDSLLKQIQDDNANELSEDHEIEGVIDGINLLEGTMHLVSCAEIGGADFPVDVTVHLAEGTTYHLRHRTDLNPDGELPYPSQNPNELVNGQEVEVELYDHVPGAGDATYWARDVILTIDDRT